MPNETKTNGANAVETKRTNEPGLGAMVAAIDNAASELRRQRETQELRAVDSQRLLRIARDLDAAVAAMTRMASERRFLRAALVEIEGQVSSAEIPLSRLVSNVGRISRAALSGNRTSAKGGQS